MNKLFVFVGPSGAGKTLISNFLVYRNLTSLDKLISQEKEEVQATMISSLTTISKALNNLSLKRIITSTSRNPRENENHGIDYYFYDKLSFEEKISNGDFLEYVNNFGNYYGTTFQSISYSLKLGSSIIVLDDDGAIKMKEILGSQAISIYLDIPLSVMEKRMNFRDDDTDSVKTRLENLKITKFKDSADFVIDSNNRIDVVLESVVKIIRNGSSSST